MARNSMPWYWPARQAWFTILEGRRVPLGPHPADAPPPRKHRGKWLAPTGIQQAFHALMATRRQPQAESPPPASLTVAEVFDRFLGWCQQHNAPRTYQWYRDHIQDFLDRQPKVAHLPSGAIRPFHVLEWVESHGDAWSNAYRRGGIVAIQRPFNWAEHLGYIPASPIKRIPKPAPQRREQVVSPDLWIQIRDHFADGDPFRDVLEFAWETGCRPQEVKRIEARHIDREHQRVVFPPAEAKGKRRWRVIYLTPRAAEILQRRMGPGLLFRNQKGRPWTAQAMACRFGRLKKHLGEKFCAYALRHGFATRKLIEGHDHLTIAQVLGHRDSRMLSEHYVHFEQNGDYLRRVVASPDDNTQGTST